MSQTLNGPPKTTTKALIPEARTYREPPRAAVAPVATAVPAAPPADPGLVGMPAFIVGSLALGLVNIGFVPATAAAAAIPIIMTATALGQLIAAVWAARLGQSAVAGLNGVFAGFWLSYSALVLGLHHNWFGILPKDMLRVQELFLLAWVIVIGLLTVSTLRLPIVFTGLLALAETSFLLSMLGLFNANPDMGKWAGWVIFGLCGVGAYLFLSGMNVATGGRPFALGRPMIR